VLGWPHLVPRGHNVTPGTTEMPRESSMTVRNQHSRKQQNPSYRGEEQWQSVHLTSARTRLPAPSHRLLAPKHPPADRTSLHLLAASSWQSQQRRCFPRGTARRAWPLLQETLRAERQRAQQVCGRSSGTRCPPRIAPQNKEEK